mgnify:FL=1
MKTEDINIDYGQTRSTHICAFKDNDSNYQFDVELLRERLEYDRDININSLSDIKDKLWELVDYLENQTVPPKFSYQILSLPQFSMLKDNFDAMIISSKLSFKDEAYLIKSFINDNRTTTTLTNDQVLIAKGSALPSVKNSWTKHIRPSINSYSGRVDKNANNWENPMFNRTLKSAKNFAKKVWNLNGKPDVGQVSSFFMNLVLGFQQKGKINLRKKLWLNDDGDFNKKNWRRLVHTSDTSPNSAHNEYVTKCFHEAKLDTKDELKEYQRKVIKSIRWMD